MKLRDIIKTDYFKLFVKREGKVVLGKHYSSLWLLCCVMTATFLAIAFSNASLNYLSFKMNDPFINWVDVQNSFGESDFKGFEAALQDPELLAQYHCKGSHTDKYWYSLYFNTNNNGRNLKCRYFADIQTPLVQAILDDDNVIGGNRIDFEMLDKMSYGVIITQDALYNKLGYTEIPPYIYYMSACDPEAEENYGVDIYSEEFAKVPVPVLAVVKRLPTNMDIIGTKYFYLQDLSWAMNLNEPSYLSSFVYFVPEKVNKAKFIETLEQTVAEHTDMSYYTMEEDLPRMRNLYDGGFVSLYFDYEDDVDFMVNKEINNAIIEKFGKDGVVRIYRYNEVDTINDPDDYISIHFEDLDMVAAFQAYAKENFKIDIEMSQITAKENFNEVSIMANILSWTMIVFAIVCITLFIINLLQSYFQKVKRNLGTFKAFGISNYELIAIYVLIMIAIIVASVAMSLCAAWLIEGLLQLFGVVRDASFGYLSLWSAKTIVSVLIIIASSVYTVYAVMRNLLKATPGDLIYDR